MKIQPIIIVLLLALLAGCGIPREAVQFAALSAQANATTQPADDTAIRNQLIAQEAAWGRLAQLLDQREIGGLTGIDENFVRLVHETAAVARRQHELINQGNDDPQFNREALARFQSLWQSANRYLNP